VGSIGSKGVSAYEAKKLAPKLTKKFIIYELEAENISGNLPERRGAAAVANMAAKTSSPYAPKVLKSCGNIVVAEKMASLMRLEVKAKDAPPMACLEESLETNLS